MVDVVVHLRWQEVEPAALRGCSVAVIDVLRWSTVVVTALANGAEFVEAFATPGAALARAEALGRERVLLGGERGNVALPGFDVGNSPLEYAAERVRGRGVITTTTNGTQALLAAREADEISVAAFVNLGAVRAHLLAARAAGRPVAIIAAGTLGAEALEDTACAGALVEGLDANTSGPAVDAWRAHGRDAARVIGAAAHAATLRAAGFGADLALAARTDAHAILPVVTVNGIRVAPSVRRTSL
jgi:2-phosphosulfolactate phosphatase